MIQRPIPNSAKANYQALIATRRGTGSIKDLPFGCSVSCRGRNWIVGGYDETLGVTTLRLVDRLCTVELLMVPPEEVSKTTASKWHR